MICNTLLEAEPLEMKAMVTFKVRENRVRHQHFPFTVNAKTQLLLQGFLPGEDPKIWINFTNDEVAEIIKL